MEPGLFVKLVNNLRNKKRACFQAIKVKWKWYGN